jgi:hypothetical protein
MKAGTTSLHEYLNQHPQVFMSREKELKLFHRDDWRNHLDWYREQFPVEAPVRGESSPGYTMHPVVPDVSARAHELIPGARLIYLVRDPVERLRAHYVEFLALGLEKDDFEVALADYDRPSNAYVMASRYAYQLDRYRQLFPDSQILVVDQTDLWRSRRHTLRRIFEFLGVDPNVDSPAFDLVHNTRAKKMGFNRLGLRLHERGLLLPIVHRSRVLPRQLRELSKRLVVKRMPEQTFPDGLRRELEAHLRHDADELRRYTGMRLEHWSV